MTMANQANFNLLSFNVRGINNKKKRLSVLRWLNKKQADIIYLQKPIPLRAVKTSGKRNGEEIYIFHTVQTTVEVSLLCFEKDLIVKLKVLKVVIKVAGSVLMFYITKKDCCSLIFTHQTDMFL